MAAIDQSQCPAVESVPGKVSGAWVFRGTRMPVATVFENLKSAATMRCVSPWERQSPDWLPLFLPGNANLPIGSGFAPQIDIIEWFGVTREQVAAVLDFAARSL